ncbi:glycoside hydrolase family 6 protein [Paenibacillus sp. MER 99-2]|uniref:glycoside hydrolase family 6 protein n=1 Tax=Paenibacillus sp. MER 99-2 TaxID=2939572 RepID=UPI0020412E07|nr:glycoside hydrolase family 6 protein [Paenibacillus sp. MER 99-2]MCM3174284.1 glycoside hydrolase family 6 protein [Paenibacillus sp. MER 99-2]
MKTKLKAKSRGKNVLRKGVKQMLAATLLAAGIFPGMSSGIAQAAEARVDNPFVGATAYLNQDYSALVDTSIALTNDATLKAKMETVKSYPTAVWIDRIAAIYGGTDNAGRKSIEQHLDAVLAQKQPGVPITASFVIYNLPGRDCHALASNGELPLTQAALQTYKTDYIDVIADIFADPKYQDIRIVAIIEPDSLPNLVTNLSTPACAQASSTGIYEDGIKYALDKLHAVPNVYNYLDIGHSGWLGWDTNRAPAIALYTSVVQDTAAGLQSADGFITNTANTTPLNEPNLPNPDLNIGGQPIRSSSFYEWNPYFDETDFTAALYSGFVQAGWPTSTGFLIDTSRNGWGGVNRPTSAIGSNINDYVNSGRIDRRDHRGNWCNNSGAGIGEAPKAAPGPAHLDAYVWVKPPGESDGSSSEIPNNEGKGFDRMCDPTFITRDGVLTGALPNAPVSGHWFHDQFVTLVKNSFPVLPANNGGGNPPGGGDTAPAAPTALTASAGNAQVSLAWTASAGATSYSVKRALSPSGPFTTIAANVSGTSFNNTGLINGTTYYYVVTAKNAVGESVNSTTATATPVAGVTTPAAPTALTATAGNAQVNLTWTASAGATSYNVKRATSAAGPFTTIAANVSGTSFTNTGLTNGTTYHYVVTAVNTAGESVNSAAASATPQSVVVPTSDLVLQYRAGDTNATDSQIKPYFNIKNVGTTAVNLSDLKIRYYFSKEGTAAMDSAIDWAQIGASNIQRTFTDSYVELSFTSGAGSIQPGGQSGEIQLRMYKTDWSSFDESNDYSYDPTKTSYQDWSKVTLYQGGNLVWGIEP